MKNTTSLRAVLATAMFVAVASASSAADHHVSTLAQLNTALSTVVPGDNVIVADGTYEDWHFTMSVDGTAGNLITLRAETPGGVTFKSGPNTTNNPNDTAPIGSYIVISADYVVVSGFNFDKIQGIQGATKNVVRFVNADYSRLTQCFFNECGEAKQAHIVQMYNGASYNEVDHNKFVGLMGQGIGVSDSAALCEFNYIHHNYLTGALRPNGGNGNEPIQLGQSQGAAIPMAATVEFNLIENMLTGYGDGELISVKTGSNIIRYNTFRNNQQSFELTLRYARDCTVEGNFILGSGLRVYGTGHKIINNFISNAVYGIDVPGGNGTTYPATNNVLIANNTIINPTKMGIALRLEFSGDALDHITVKNNLITGSAALSTLFYQETAVTSITYAGNLGYATGSATLKGPDLGIVVAVTSDPSLVTDGEVMRLPAGASSAKGAGVAVPDVTLDMDSQARGSPLDIGADRYVAGLVITRPLVASDVGPAWLGGPPVADGTTGTAIAVPASSVVASGDDGTGNVAAHAVDASLATRWSAPGDGATLRFDLGATYTVTHVNVATHLGDTRRTGFHVQVSNDDVVWTDAGSTATRPLLTSGTTLALETFDIPDVRTRYLRLVGHRNTTNDFTSLTWVEVCGKSPTLTAFADTYAAGGTPNTNFGTAVELGVKENGTSSVTYDRIAYVKFDLSKLTFSPSTSTLVFTTSAATAAGTLTVNRCATDSWSETGLNWTNKPAVGTVVASTAIAGGVEADVSIAVSSYVSAEYAGPAPKIVTFALTGNNAVLLLKSRETGNDAPTLVLTP